MRFCIKKNYIVKVNSIWKKLSLNLTNNIYNSCLGRTNFLFSQREWARSGSMLYFCSSCIGAVEAYEKGTTTTSNAFFIICQAFRTFHSAVFVCSSGTGLLYLWKISRTPLFLVKNFTVQLMKVTSLFLNP